MMFLKRAWKEYIQIDYEHYLNARYCSLSSSYCSVLFINPPILYCTVQYCSLSSSFIPLLLDPKLYLPVLTSGYYYAIASTM